MTNYNRYLDLHLCTSTIQGHRGLKNPKKYFTHRGREYLYDFMEDINRQQSYREAKNEGVQSGFWSAMKSESNARLLSSSEVTYSERTFLRLKPDGTISDELSRIRYVACIVSIERLTDGQTHPQLQSLVKWIADPNTTNKLRINCHGGGTDTDGFSMGGQIIQPDALVRALCRHGLTRVQKSMQNVTGLAHNARWKMDSEVLECEGDGCGRNFQTAVPKSFLSSGKHHCRRCGGIFCENCSRWRVDLARALVGTSNRTERVNRARVCQKCYDDVTMVPNSPQRAIQGTEGRFGLQQITLALCMGAKSSNAFSHERPAIRLDPAKAGFAAGSLACRLVNALRAENITGVTVSASNTIVQSVDGQIQDTLGVDWPTTSGRVETTNGKTVGGGRQQFDFPAVIWGSSTSVRQLWRQTTPQPDEHITVASDQRSIDFGGASNPAAITTLANSFYARWQFPGWVMLVGGGVFKQPSLAAPKVYTLRLKPPEIVERARLQPHPTDPHKNRVVLEARQASDWFKDYKSYGTS